MTATAHVDAAPVALAFRVARDLASSWRTRPGRTNAVSAGDDAGRIRVAVSAEGHRPGLEIVLVPEPNGVTIAVTLSGGWPAAVRPLGGEERRLSAACAQRVSRLNRDGQPDLGPRSVLGRPLASTLTSILLGRRGDDMSVREMLSDLVRCGPADLVRAVDADLTPAEIAHDIDLLSDCGVVVVRSWDARGRPTQVALAQRAATASAVACGAAATPLQVRMLGDPGWSVIVAVLRHEIEDLTALRDRIDEANRSRPAGAAAIGLRDVIQSGMVVILPNGRPFVTGRAAQVARAMTSVAAGLGTEVAEAYAAEELYVSFSVETLESPPGSEGAYWCGRRAASLRRVVDELGFIDLKRVVICEWISRLTEAARLDPSAWGAEAMRAHAEAVILSIAWGLPEAAREAADQLATLATEADIVGAAGVDPLVVMGIATALRTQPELAVRHLAQWAMRDIPIPPAPTQPLPRPDAADVIVSE